MKYSIVYSSKTGNTAKLADSIRMSLPHGDCTYFGEIDAAAIDAPLIFVGFWTDKGVVDANAAKFLESIHQKRVFLFGTAGFGGSAEYFDKILLSANNSLNASNKVVGSFMCQGKMPVSVRERYEKMLTGGEGDAKIKGMIQNFDGAATHPDASDLEHLTDDVNKLQKECII